jgi:hypothetical protein
MIATLAAPLGATSPQAALALYDLARTSGAASAYEAAAHALARALQRQIIIGATLRPSAPLSAALGAPSEQAAPVAAKKRTARAERVEDDLAALFSRPPRNKAATGAFWCVWADGTATRVCGVVYHGGKPQTRWAAALAAGDTLRRLRARHEYARQLEAMAGVELRAMQVRTSCGVMADSPDWQHLARVRPMAALLAIYDENTGETFTPPPGGRYGAGDANEAANLEARIVPPRLFWREAEISAQGGRIFRGRAHSPGIAYEMDGSGHLRVADGACDFLASRRAAAVAAFELPPVIVAKATAVPGATAPTNMHDLDGAAVVFDLAGIVAAFERASTEAKHKARALLLLVERHATAPEGGLVRYTARRLAGGFAFRLTASDGTCVTLDAPRAVALRLAA